MFEAANFGLGALQSLIGLTGLNKLHQQPDPQFSEAPEQKASRLRAEEMAKGGFTPEEKAARDAKLLRSENTGYTKTLDTAPTQARAVLAGANYANAGAQNDFAATDAALHRKNIQYSDKFSEELQGIADKNIQMQEQNRRAAEQSLGGAVSSGLGNIVSTLDLAQVTGGGKKAAPTGTGSDDPFGWYKRLKSIQGMPGTAPAAGGEPYSPPTTDWANTGGY